VPAGNYQSCLERELFRVAIYPRVTSHFIIQLDHLLSNETVETSQPRVYESNEFVLNRPSRRDGFKSILAKLRRRSLGIPDFTIHQFVA